MDGTISNADWQYARDLVRDYVRPLSEIRLGQLCRDIERIDREREKRLQGSVTPRLISGLLRMLDWKKAGTTGTGYDREPLYKPKGALS